MLSEFSPLRLAAATMIALPYRADAAADYDAALPLPIADYFAFAADSFSLLLLLPPPAADDS